MMDPGAIFEQARPRLTGLAYRLLGTMAEAEDAVQDTGLRWLASDHRKIDNADGWLTRVCTNRCLDILKSAARQRVDYVGPWLPEPLHTPTARTAEDDLMLADSLSTAFLLLLDRLTPRERAAYLLHDIFDQPHGDVAKMLDISPANSRQLVSRARTHVGADRSRARVDPDLRMPFLAAFQRALTSLDTDELAQLLSRDIELHADGGGKVRAARRVLIGPAHVLGFFKKVMLPAWSPQNVEIHPVNGCPGLIARENGQVTAVLTLHLNDVGMPDRIFIMRNPDKLRHIMTGPGYQMDGPCLYRRSCPTGD